jgi:tetratricopeptide (TPR) repeat protein
MQQLITDIVAAMQGARHDDAVRMARELAVAMPDEEGALSLLAVSEQNVGNLDTARGLLERLTREHPATWQHWNNLGNVLRVTGDLDGAASAYAAALERNDASARLHANLGLLRLNRGDFAGAREALCRAAAMPGAEPGMAVWAAVACHASTDEDAARALLRDWRDWPRQSDEVTLELGWLLVQLGQVEDGEAVLRGPFQDPVTTARATARRVLALERVNRLDDAAALAAGLPGPAALADPRARMELLNARAQLAARRGDMAAARQDYEQALAIDGLPAHARAPLLFGLARACDKQDDTAAAFAALTAAHAADPGEPASLPPHGLLALVDAAPASNAGPWDETPSPAAEASPVFVTGFPRSGTTLVEQVLGAHPDFVSVDERPFVERMLLWMREHGFAFPGDLDRLGAAECEALRSVYWRAASMHATLTPGMRLIDKQPFNFLALPLIRRVFANAPLVFCLRHPCDAILSCHLQQFRDPQLARLCASIDSLAQAWVRIAQRWLDDAARWPQQIHVCRYETLVTDFEGESARLGAFLGIADVRAMQGFAEHARERGYIATPSYAQVVQPLNPDSIGRWQRYRAAFEPVLPLLAPLLEHWGYDA